MKYQHQGPGLSIQSQRAATTLRALTKRVGLVSYYEGTSRVNAHQTPYLQSLVEEDGLGELLEGNEGLGLCHFLLLVLGKGQQLLFRQPLEPCIPQIDHQHLHNEGTLF